jgi:SAM-dependent methyltransferase
MTIRAEELTSNRIYDGYASHYGFDVDANMASRLKYDLALKYLKPDDEVLDVGCANGIHMRLLARGCQRITGIDISQPMLDVAREALEKDGITNASLELRSATDLRFADAGFDLVYSFSTLTLVPDVNQALREIARVLKPGGIALLDVVGRWNLSRVYWGRYFRLHGHFGQRSFTYGAVMRQLDGIGLDIMETHALGFLDQWRYIPGLHWCKGLDRVLHRSLHDDLDYRVSNQRFFFPLANRWYLACRKAS